MAVSNPPSMASIMAEFGGNGSFRDYYRGGPYVPNTPANQAISTNPNNLAMNTFGGATRYTPMSGYITPNPIGDTGVGAVIVGATCVVGGGTPPYRYTWGYAVSSAGGSSTMAIANGSSQSASFTCRADLRSGGWWDGTIYCVVADATGAQVQINATGSFIINADDRDGR